MIVVKHVTGVMGFYWSYTLLLEPPVLIAANTTLKPFNTVMGNNSQSGNGPKWRSLMSIDGYAVTLSAVFQQHC